MLIATNQKNKIPPIKLNIKYSKSKTILATNVQLVKSKQANLTCCSSYIKSLLAS